MDLLKLEVFVRVVEMGSLSRASLVMGMDTSVISRQLTALETQFQGRLLHRTGRGVQLTALGERVLPHVHALLDKARALSDEIGTASGVCTGTVRLACLPGLAAPLLIPVMKTMRERHPQATVNIVEGFSGQVEQWLAEGTVDLGFVLRSTDETDVPISRGRICLVGPPHDRLTLHRELDFSALDGLPMLLPATVTAFRAQLLNTAEQAGIRLNVVAGVDSLQMQKEMVAAGIGYALLSLTSVLRELKTGQLSATRLVNPEITRSIYLGMSPRKQTNAATQALAQLVRQAAREMTLAGAWGDEAPVWAA